MKYGAPPEILGSFRIKTDEMMAYLYLPVRIGGGMWAVPQRLKRYGILLTTAFANAPVDMRNYGHVYITAKTLFCTPENPGNRPGWHVDGWGSDGDLNYIWYDGNPTEFAVQEFVDIPKDDFASMEAMSAQVRPECIRTYPSCQLLRLDESVVHRVSETVTPGMRTFVKISISMHRYNLKGNSRNYLLKYDWPMYDRTDRRNIDNRDFVAEGTLKRIRSHGW